MFLPTRFLLRFLLSSNLLLAVVGAAVAASHQCHLVINVAENGKTGVCKPPIPAYDDSSNKISCPNVSSAFHYISMISNVTAGNCVHVNMSSGHHNFTQPQNLSISLILTGTGSTTIRCAYDSSSRPAFTPADLLYTLFLVRVAFVKFEMVRFEKCKQPFRLEEVSNVSIVNSYFTEFTDAVLDLYNCISINIDNSTFINNIGRGTVFLPLRGNTGAVSIGYHNSDNFDNNTTPTISITDCCFENNDAAVKDDTFSTSTTAFLLNRFTGRGGSIAFLMNLTVGDLNVNINRCMFKQNHAVSFGGAIYMLFSSRELYHMIIIEDCLFINNVADNGAGAVQVTFHRAEVLSGQPITAIIRNCNFTGNSAVIGGAVFLFPSLEGEEGNLLIIEGCYFYKNHANETGAAVTASQFAFFIPKEKLINHRITNW